VSKNVEEKDNQSEVITVQRRSKLVKDDQDIDEQCTAKLEQTT